MKKLIALLIVLSIMLSCFAEGSKEVLQRWILLSRQLSEKLRT